MRSCARALVVLVLALQAVVTAAPAAAGDCFKPDDLPDEGWQPYEGTDPTRVRLPYTPWRMLAAPCPFPPEYRAVAVEPGRVVVLEGGQVVREAALPEGGELRFEDVVAAVADPSWLGEVEPGVFLVDTALIQRASVLAVTAPAVRELRLTTRPHVFLGGLGSAARFDGVTVTSWDPAAAAPDRDPADGRAFVLYRDGSRLDIVRSTFEHLGSDRSEAYGVSWRGRSTGSAVDSTFAHNFFGAYLYRAESVVFRGNVFRQNVRYGLDPHDHSRNLTIEHNESFGNGTHGIVFSSSVHGSVIRDNTVHHNGMNGIVLHKGSSDNVIERNRVEHNRHDGIVLIDSGDVRVAGNSVRGHEIGIRLNGTGSQRVLVQANTLEDNRVGLQAYGGADLVTSEGNLHRRSGDVALSLDVPHAEVVGDQIVRSPRGIDVVTGRAAIRSVRMTNVDEGLVARGSAQVDFSAGEVRARRTGVRAVPGTVVVTGGTIDAPRPFSWLPPDRSPRSHLGYVGIAALAVAVALHLVSLARNRGPVGGAAPGHVRNAA